MEIFLDCDKGDACTCNFKWHKGFLPLPFNIHICLQLSSLSAPLLCPLLCRLWPPCLPVTLSSHAGVIKCGRDNEIQKKSGRLLERVKRGTEWNSANRESKRNWRKINYISIFFCFWWCVIQAECSCCVLKTITCNPCVSKLSRRTGADWGRGWRGEERVLGRPTEREGDIRGETRRGNKRPPAGVEQSGGERGEKDRGGRDGERCGEGGGGGGGRREEEEEEEEEEALSCN